jgi:hypothetical protein
VCVGAQHDSPAAAEAHWAHPGCFHFSNTLNLP